MGQQPFVRHEIASINDHIIEMDERIREIEKAQDAHHSRIAAIENGVIGVERRIAAIEQRQRGFDDASVWARVRYVLTGRRV